MQLYVHDCLFILVVDFAAIEVVDRMSNDTQKQPLVQKLRADKLVWATAFAPAHTVAPIQGSCDFLNDQCKMLNLRSLPSADTCARQALTAEEELLRGKTLDSTS